MKKYLIILFVFLGFNSLAQDDVEYRVIPSITDWIEEINNWPDSVYLQENLHIEIDPVKDEGFVYPDRDQFDSLHLLQVERKEIIKQIVVYRL